MVLEDGTKSEYADEEDHMMSRKGSSAGRSGARSDARRPKTLAPPSVVVDAASTKRPALPKKPTGGQPGVQTTSRKDLASAGESKKRSKKRERLRPQAKLSNSAGLGSSPKRSSPKLKPSSSSGNGGKDKQGRGAKVKREEPKPENKKLSYAAALMTSQRAPKPTPPNRDVVRCRVLSKADVFRGAFGKDDQDDDDRDDDFADKYRPLVASIRLDDFSHVAVTSLRDPTTRTEDDVDDDLARALAATVPPVSSVLHWLDFSNMILKERLPATAVRADDDDDDDPDDPDDDDADDDDDESQKTPLTDESVPLAVVKEELNVVALDLSGCSVKNHKLLSSVASLASSLRWLDVSSLCLYYIPDEWAVLRVSILKAKGNNLNQWPERAFGLEIRDDDEKDDDDDDDQEDDDDSAAAAAAADEEEDDSAAAAAADPTRVLERRRHWVATRLGSSLRELDLSQNELKEVPENVKLLARLEVLDVSTNEIAYVDDALFDQVPALTRVDLQNNNVLEDLGSSLPKFLKKPGHSIDLANCPELRTPPSEVADAGAAAVVTFFDHYKVAEGALQQRRHRAFLAERDTNRLRRIKDIEIKCNARAAEWGGSAGGGGGDDQGPTTTTTTGSSSSSPFGAQQRPLLLPLQKNKWRGGGSLSAARGTLGTTTPRAGPVDASSERGSVATERGSVAGLLDDDDDDFRCASVCGDSETTLSRPGSTATLYAGGGGAPSSASLLRGERAPSGRHHSYDSIDSSQRIAALVLRLEREAADFAELAAREEEKLLQRTARSAGTAQTPPKRTAEGGGQRSTTSTTTITTEGTPFQGGGHGTTTPPPKRVASSPCFGSSSSSPPQHQELLRPSQQQQQQQTTPTHSSSSSSHRLELAKARSVEAERDKVELLKILKRLACDERQAVEVFACFCSPRELEIQDPGKPRQLFPIPESHQLQLMREVMAMIDAVPAPQREIVPAARWPADVVRALRRVGSPQSPRTGDDVVEPLKPRIFHFAGHCVKPTTWWLRGQQRKKRPVSERACLVWSTSGVVEHRDDDDLGHAAAKDFGFSLPPAEVVDDDDDRKDDDAPSAFAAVSNNKGPFATTAAATTTTTKSKEKEPSSRKQRLNNYGSGGAADFARFSSISSFSRSPSGGTTTRTTHSSQRDIAAAPTLEELVDVLKECDGLELCFLNACHSEGLANDILQSLGGTGLCLICWKTAVSDKPASTFARYFYEQIGKHPCIDVEDAFHKALASWKRDFIVGDPHDPEKTQGALRPHGVPCFLRKVASTQPPPSRRQTSKSSAPAAAKLSRQRAAAVGATTTPPRSKSYSRIERTPPLGPL